MPHGLFLHAVAGGEYHMSCVTGSPPGLKVGRWSENPSVLPVYSLLRAGAVSSYYLIV